MTHKLRINRADIAAAKQSGYPPLFYTIKRKYGDETATLYLKKYHDAQRRTEKSFF